MKFTYICLGCLIWSAVACKQDREIKVYKVAKESAPAATPPAPAGDPHAGVPGMAAGDPHAGMPPGAMPSGAPAKDPHAGFTAEQLATVGGNSSPRVTDTPPAHWKKTPTSSMRQASYEVEGDGGTSVSIALVILRGAAGGNLDNVNRWRGQLGQPPMDEPALKKSAQSLTTPVGPAVAVEIEGLAEGSDAKKDGRMVGVIASSEGDAWFYKMRGNAALVSQEKDNFLKWVLTVKPTAPTPPAPDPPAPAADPPAPDAPAPDAPAPTPDAPASTADGSLTWQVSDGWTLASVASSMRCATVSVKSVRFTQPEE